LRRFCRRVYKVHSKFLLPDSLHPHSCPLVTNITHSLSLSRWNRCLTAFYTFVHRERIHYILHYRNASRLPYCKYSHRNPFSRRRIFYVNKTSLGYLIFLSENIIIPAPVFLPIMVNVIRLCKAFRHTPLIFSDSPQNKNRSFHLLKIRIYDKGIPTEFR
jgi:hypothetical protein